MKVISHVLAGPAPVRGRRGNRRPPRPHGRDGLPAGQPGAARSGTASTGGGVDR